MKKKTTYYIIAFIVLAAVTVLLLRNRAKLAAGSSGIKLSAFPVTVTTAQLMPLSDELTYTGTITANNDVAIVAETSGRVTALRARVGDVKQAGAVLIEVDSELAAANCTAAEMAYEKAKRDLERNENLLKNNSIAQSQYEAVRLNYRAAEAQYIAARRALQNTKITTPISGTVTSCAVDTGAMVQRDKIVANVVDIATLKVKINIPEEDVFKLVVGDTALVTTDVYPGVTFNGIIYTIGAKADEAHTYPVEVTLANDDNNPLKANMFGRVTFTSLSSTAVLVLPRATLIGSVIHPQVFVVNGTTARLRNITIGECAGLNIEVRDGLTLQDTVVVNGQYNLRDGAEVMIVKQGDRL